MNDNLETQVKVPAFDDATIAALEAEKLEGGVLHVQVEDEVSAEEVTLH